MRGVRFPHLSSLTITFHSLITPCDTSSSYPHFVRDHSETIEELDLDFQAVQIWWGAGYFSDAFLSGLEHSSFPRLRSFRGDTRTFELMACARLPGLGATLQQLEVRSIAEREPSRSSELIHMSDAIVHCGCYFSVLKELTLDMTSIRPHELQKVVCLIRNCETICRRSLEVWHGTLPCFKIDAGLVGELFAPFERLRVLHLDAENVSAEYDDAENIDPESVIEENVKMIASKCLALEEIVENWSTDNYLPIRWTILRTPSTLRVFSQ
jgi:hypothetical protein